MNKEYFLIIDKLKSHYANGGNVIEFLRNHFNRSTNIFDDILISYDLQAGSYVKAAKERPDYIEKHSSDIYSIVKELGSCSSILEAGVGEATTFGHVLKRFDSKKITGYGIDLSWSRIKYAHSYLKFLNINNCFVSTGNIFSLPFGDNSIDIVYTSHSIEPNGGNEKPLLEELYRVARKYLVLLEPAYDLASPEAKERMKKHGYCIELWNEIKNLNYKVIEHRLMEVSSNPLNPTGLTIIEKNNNIPDELKNPLACPVTRYNLEQKADCFYSENASLAYPIIQGIPCLLPENAIIATHFND